MKRLSLIVVVVGLALIARWWPRADHSTSVHPSAGIEVAARQSPTKGLPSTIQDESVGLLDEPGDEEPGLAPLPPRASAVPPLPRTIKLAAGAEPPSPLSPQPIATGTDGAVDDDSGERPADLGPVTVLENHRAAFRQYALKYGGNPVGDNAEITAALRGQNPRQSVFLTARDGLRVNSEGQAVDVWGTPYFFHQLSRTEMEIRSAGPDHRMWTSDDLVLK